MKTPALGLRCTKQGRKRAAEFFLDDGSEGGVEFWLRENDFSKCLFARGIEEPGLRSTPESEFGAQFASGRAMA
jgi:hypothetical protein